ncbi:hypothetical protein SDRG_10313 [Saprolegnia diclina VS20]|uniref:Ricin B lectin domain-containing protein n=1 Tax=Saprolegnia diclina (strain VS20) TaxID=1156394 RepID=T0RQ23_SAPDV|nr:hypothetical protein SDRG_10313 [Saprolegnia diclina VS20]EQC32117.1 hypothetical protein SDRG_10313 [Saprolegnia diclina VS20]|eukprot:XP_008614519.1 hypothetical protein SDRG_10313 [Saprolegnia diclina VS20]
MLMRALLSTLLLVAVATSLPTPTYPRSLDVTLNTILNKVVATAGGRVVAADHSSTVWRYDTWTHELRTEDACLGLSSEDVLALAPCTGHRRQTWTIDGADSRISHRAEPSLCLQVDLDNSVRAAPCTSHVESPYQYVFLSSETVVLTTDTTHVLSTRDASVVVEVRTQQDPRLVPSWRFDKVNGTLQSNENGLCLHVTPSYAVVAHDCDHSSMQQWWYEATQLTNAATPGYCLTLDGTPRIARCQHIPSQRVHYEMVDTFTT